MKLLCDLTVTSRPLRPRTGLPQPALRMDFVNGTYHPGGFGSAISFTRAGSARYFDASGVMQVAAADVPRIDHHPVTLARRGLLIEGARTNLLTQSATFGVWGPLNATLAGSAQPSAAPGETMMLLTENTVNGAHQISAASGALAAGLHVFSADFLPAGRSKIALIFTGASLGSLTLYADLLAGTASITGGTGIALIAPVGGGRWRVSLMFTAAASEVITLRIRLRDAAGSEGYTGDGVSGVYLGAGQLEAGDCPTSYIPTAGSTVTRAADVAQVPLGAWWPGAAAGTLLAEFECSPVPQLAIVAYFNSTAFNNSAGLSKSNAANNGAGTHIAGAMFDGSSALSVPLDTGAAPGPYRAAMTWGGGTMRAAANGTPGAQVAQRNPVPTKFWLGQRDGGGLPLNGWLRRVSYWPRRMTDGELVAAVS